MAGGRGSVGWSVTRPAPVGVPSREDLSPFFFFFFTVQSRDLRVMSQQGRSPCISTVRPSHRHHLHVGVDGGSPSRTLARRITIWRPRRSTSDNSAWTRYGHEQQFQAVSPLVVATATNPEPPKVPVRLWPLR